MHPSSFVTTPLGVFFTKRHWLCGLVLLLSLALLTACRPTTSSQTVELRARIAEAGGWSPAAITIPAGQPLHLELATDDMKHGFAVGHLDSPAVEILPGQTAETTLTFTKPGKYVYYCTVWCGPGHWRMRGVIEVTNPGTAAAEATPEPPLYVTLGLDIDAPHPAEVVPAEPPVAARAAALGLELPANYLTPDYYRSHSPAETWLALRATTAAQNLSDQQIWELVAAIWQANTTPETLAEGADLYAANCATCHGDSGAGDGVMAAILARNHPPEMEAAEFGHTTQPPTDFTDASQRLGASPALLHGKIIRGGMGTGMPYWGPIFTEAQTWAVVDYLWTFVFEYEEEQ
jgi:mono/diheme cytochrome c family protein/plastocyanin